MSGLGRLSLNPIDGAIQSVSWLKGGLHHAILTAAVIALAGWLGWWPSHVATLMAGYYIGESTGSYVGRYQSGLKPGWRDPLTDAIWPVCFVVLYLWAGYAVALLALLGAGCLRFAWSLRG